MYPGFFGWWKRAHHHGADVTAHFGHGGCGTGGGPGWGPPGWGPGGRGPGGGGGDDDGFGGGFGVRRPLRFLAWKLELEEGQVAELAAVIDELKTERAQAAVDLRRTTSALADAIGVSELDESKINEATNGRVKATERLQASVAKALTKIHKILDDEQRKRLAYLIRTGVISM